MDERQGWEKIGVAAALAERYGRGERDFLESLAHLLELALPGDTRVERRGGWFAQKTVARITVNFDEMRYTLEDPGHGSLKAGCTRVVRGIALKTEELPVQQWLEELAAALDHSAGTSRATREALKQLTGNV